MLITHKEFLIRRGLMKSVLIMHKKLSIRGGLIRGGLIRSGITSGMLIRSYLIILIN